MVRLFIPEGEGQHGVVNSRPGALPAQPDVVASPWRSSIAATGVTGFLALVGHSRPGTFLRCAAFFSAVDLTWTAAEIYGRRELNRAVFKMDSITPRPGKLWERTEFWSAEDATLIGGGMGILMALNPRALPGAYGVSRFLGAATVGCALGYKLERSALIRVNPRLVDFLELSEKALRGNHYDRLRNNDEAKASLSAFGRLALTYHTSPYTRVLRERLSIPMVISDGRQHAHHPRSSSQAPTLDSSLHADADKFALIQVEFQERELVGPDMEAGYRTYRDDVQSRDASSIQDWMDRIHSIKMQVAREIPRLWKQLAQKENEFYLQRDEDREKDVSRRELQLLNNMTFDLVVRYAILAYYEADARKQLRQMTQTNSIPPEPSVAEDPPEPSTGDGYPGPQIVAELVRLNWSRQKELLSRFEKTIAQYEALPSAVTRDFDQIKRVRQNAEELRKNIEATERLLRRFEVQIHEAEQVTKQRNDKPV